MPPFEASATTAALSLAWALARAMPRTRVTRSLGRPDVVVEVKIGNLFDEPGHLIVGFNDVFDTDCTGGNIISRTSIQGQFLELVYSGDRERLDADLSVALAGVSESSRELRSQKRAGKLVRYPVGSVAVLSERERRYYCSAYGKMGNDLTVRSSLDDLWLSLGELWRAIEISGRREPVAMPVIGSEMARIDHVDREVLIRMIILSFVARSRERLIAKKLTVVVHPSDAHRVDMLEMGAFLKVL
ncbi:macro domain-containing protein [Kitasatospora sp. MMS16-BH015]|uniref:macro domain-containing protein n=1 Tax=Kitasatospora sp. MMS16-BH015 TaxID=2018025 RepID=UPI000CF2EEDF|nr:macro domain-containing protein [Kitasatospora sp. MMS16-BH015]